VTEKRAGRELARWVAVTLAVLLTAYVGAYYALVDVFPVPTANGFPPIYRGAGYGSLQKNLRRFFAPIHWLDRRLWPHVWEPK
jgi:hypothetical protein